MYKKELASKSSEQLLQELKTEYHRINAKSGHDYKKRHDKRLPSWEYVAKRCGVRTWYELCDLCGLSKVSDKNNNQAIITTSFLRSEAILKSIESKYKNL